MGQGWPGSLAGSMPELPEVEIARRQLDRWLTGTQVDAEAVDPAVVRTHLSSRPSDAHPEGPALLKQTMGTAEPPLRHGKRIAWPFGDRAVLVHLGMTGRLAQNEQGNAVRARFSQVAFVDRRRFGCLVVVDRDRVHDELRAGHGPDALDEALDGAGLKAALTGRRAIKVALMDQARIAGLGNIHAAEALWRAGIDPRRACDRVTRWDALADAIVAQLEETIAAEDEGTLVYVTDGGPNRFAVYGREGEPCPKCSAPIERFVQGGRATFACSGCQPA